MALWDYKTVVRTQGELLTDEQLNVLGAHGYELVSVLSHHEKHMVVGRQEEHTTVHYFFKRPRPAGVPAQPANGNGTDVKRPAAPAPAGRPTA